MDPIAPVAAQQASIAQTLSLSAIKQTAQEGQAIANILDQSAQNIAATDGRGANVDLVA
jgi:hypothetical protein